jgi:hypothetical protein
MEIEMRHAIAGMMFLTWLGTVAFLLKAHFESQGR